MATVDENKEALREEEESSLDLKEILYLCLSNWYWILISVIICVGLGVLYILRSNPVYTRDAQIVIKEDNKRGGRATSQLEEFGSFNLFGSNTNLLNEIATIKSPDMMARVVKQLDLNMNYTVPGRFHRDVLYGTNLPVKVNMYTLAPTESARFTLKLGQDSTVALSEFKIKDKEYEKTVKGRIGQTLKTPLGDIAVYATQYYNAKDLPEEIFVSRSTIKGATDHYCKEMTITQDDEKSGVVNMSINDVSIERADDIVNALINTYNRNWVDDRNEIAISTRDFIEDRLNVIVSELEGVDNDISSYKSSNLVPDLSAASQMYMQQANLSNNELLDLNNKLYMATYVKAHLTNPTQKFQLIPTNSGFETPAMSAEIGNYNSMVLDRNNLLANSSESNPLVVDMDKSLRDMRASIIQSIDHAIEDLKGQIRGMEKRENEAISRISSNPQQAKYLLSVERQQKVKESLYLYLLQKREENELTQTFTPYNTKVIMEPQGSDFPSSPRKVRILLVAFLLGILIPVGIIVLDSTLNTKVRGRKDLEVLTAPFVGEIPQYKGHKKGGGKRKGKKNKGRGEAFIVVKEGNRNVINEAFRVIRTNLEFMAADHKVIAITSANPDSGKTFIDYNLAASFAIKGKRVLAIDCDLRKGSLSEYCHNPKKGLTDYLVGKVDDINDVIVQDTENKNLYILPKGTTPPNPTELLYTPRFAETIQKLRDEYDIVFIDCPPVEIVADAAIVNKEADMTLFIIRAGLFERSMLPEIEKFYKQQKYKNVAIILNGTEASTHYGQRYGYRYGYHYGYHYGSYAGYGSDKD